MAAPLGNQFWKLRSKHGRDKLFESPELMWEAACDYFEWVINNPDYEVKPMVVSQGKEGSTVEMIQIPIKKPFLLEGLCLYMGCTSSYFRNFKMQERAKAEDFMTVIAKIEEVIYSQKISGAISGYFNSNIIARHLGLKDSTEVKHEGIPAPPPVNVYNTAPPRSRDESQVDV